MSIKLDARRRSSEGAVAWNVDSTKVADGAGGSELAEAAEALAAAPIFGALTPLDRAKLAAVLEERWLDAGSVVFEAGGHGDALYILRAGTAERRVAGASIGKITPPEIFGELALLTDEPRSASVVALTPLRLWVLPRARFHPLLRREPELLLRLSAAVSRQLARTRRQLGEIQRELDAWVGQRLAELDASERALVEQAALFTTIHVEPLAYVMDDVPADVRRRLEAVASRSPLLVRDGDGFRIPEAVRDSIARHLESTAGHGWLAARRRALGLALEARGHWSEAVAAYLAAGARAEARHAIQAAPPQERAELLRWSEIASWQRDGAGEPADGADAARLQPERRLGIRRTAGLAAATLPLLLWGFAPPELGAGPWRVLLLLVSAAILLALDVVPDAVVALALLAGWVVPGLVEPRVALAGFASETWLLVFGVLAVGAAVGNTGLLYRAALLALSHTPPGFAWRCVSLAAVGTIITPTLPNATSRMALAAPLIRELAEALGHRPTSRAATGLALAGLVGFGQMSALFLTGSSVGLLVHGLLPPAIRAEFGFGGWFVAALPLHLVLAGLALATIALSYQSGPAAAGGAERLALQQAVLGPPRREEWLCLVVLAALILGFLTEPLHGVHAAWLTIGAIAALVLGGVLDSGMLRTGVNWTFLIFFGVITSLAGVFSTLGIDRWLAQLLAAPVAAVAVNPLAFCLSLACGGFVLSFLVRWQAAAPLLTLVAMPVAEPLGINPFLVALIALVSTQLWCLPYQSTVYLALYHGSGEMFSHAGARRLALSWVLMVAVAIAAAVPVWQMQGLLR